VADPSEESTGADPETGSDDEPEDGPQQVAGVELAEAGK